LDFGLSYSLNSMMCLVETGERLVVHTGTESYSHRTAKVLPQVGSSTRYLGIGISRQIDLPPE